MFLLVPTLLVSLFPRPQAQCLSLSKTESRVSGSTRQACEASRLVLASALPQTSQKAHNMQADPGSPQSQKYTCETFKDKMSPKVSFPRLWGERPQRQSSGLEPGNVPWLPSMAPTELLSLVLLRLWMEDFSGAERSQEESPLGLSLARLRHSGSSHKPAVC